MTSVAVIYRRCLRPWAWFGGGRQYRLRIELAGIQEAFELTRAECGYVPAALAPANCRHIPAVPVRVETGRLVGWLCPVCGVELAADLSTFPGGA